MQHTSTVYIDQIYPYGSIDLRQAVYVALPYQINFLILQNDDVVALLYPGISRMIRLFPQMLGG